MVRQYVMNQPLNRSSFGEVMRKVARLLHIDKVRAKVGMSIFSGTLLLGSGLVFAAAQHTSSLTNNASTASPSAQPETTSSVNPVPEVQQAPPTNAPTTTQSNSNDQTNTSTNSVQVNVNGDDIAVPSTGNVHRTITSNDGTTTIDVTTNSSNQNGTQAFTNIQTNSFSTSFNQSTSVQSGGSN